MPAKWNLSFLDDRVVVLEDMCQVVCKYVLLKERGPKKKKNIEVIRNTFISQTYKQQEESHRGVPQSQARNHISFIPNWVHEHTTELSSSKNYYSKMNPLFKGG